MVAFLTSDHHNGLYHHWTRVPAGERLTYPRVANPALKAGGAHNAMNQF